VGSDRGRLISPQEEAKEDKDNG